MPCEHVRFPDGTTAIVCHRGKRRKHCSTPNCHNWATLECDAPVNRKQKKPPAEGDVRVHLKSERLFVVVGTTFGVVTALSEEQQERAAIIEYDGGFDRAVAEALAKDSDAVPVAVRVAELKRDGSHGQVFKQSVEDWFEKTRATCNRAICARCAVRVGALDYCGPHGRQALDSKRSAT